MIWVRKIHTDHRVQHPCTRQGHQPPDVGLELVAQGPIQPGLEHHQEWSIHCLSGNPFQHLITLSVKNLPLTSNVSLPSLSL